MKTQRWYEAVRSPEAQEKKREWARRTNHGVVHGHNRPGHRTPTYNSWRAVMDRCLRPNTTKYFRYGAKGITVCERWLKFENFIADMGERPEGTTLDRWPNNRGNYEPGNCRWATPKEQADNCTRDTRFKKGWNCG